MKTDELRDAREKYLEAADEKKKLAKARDELNQFQEIKKILFNIQLKDKSGTKLLGTDIIWDVMDEVRSERKILMVLKNENTENYVNLDMTEIDMLKYHEDKSIPYEVQLAC